MSRAPAAALDDDILHHIQSRLEAVDHVAAAWLSGSRGRGTADTLSDIDLWLAIEDDAIGKLIEDPLIFVHDIVPTIMHIQAPSIAPPGGVYLLTWVPIGDGFEQVDWYWTPVSSAHRPAQTRLLMERRPIPVAPLQEVARLDADAWIAVIDGTIKDTLLMIANTWKHVRRRNAWRAVNHFQHVGTCLSQLDLLLRERHIPAFNSTTRTFLPDTVPHQLEDQREALQEMLGALGLMAARAGRSHEFDPSMSALSAVLSS